MHIFLDLAFKDSSSRGLVEAGSLEDMRRIDPVVVATAHDMFLQICSKLVLVHWYLCPYPMVSGASQDAVVLAPAMEA